MALDADEASIKRAYARLLKQHRPDTDPAGFQVLYEAYQQALAWCRRSSGAKPRDAGVATHEPAALEQAPPPRQPLGDMPRPPAIARTQEPREMPQPVSLPRRQPPCDPQAVAREIVAHAIEGTAPALQHWLEQHPVMWSLQDKMRVGQALFGVLDQESRPIEAARFDILQRFFEWDTLGGDVDPMRLDDARHDANHAWELRPDALEVLADTLSAQGPADVPAWRLRKDLAQLAPPFAWRSALFNAIPIGEADRMRDLLDSLQRVPDGTLVPPIGERNRVFWQAAADPTRFSLDRVLVYAARCLLVTAILSLFVVPIVALRNASTVWDVLRQAAVAWMSLSAIVVACAVAVEFCHWQALPETAVRRWRWAHLLCIPVLSALTLLLADRVWWPIPWALAIALLIVACVRGFQRHYLNPFHQPVWRVAPVLLLVCFVALTSRVIEIPLAAAMGYWLLDAARQMVRQRRRTR